MKPNATATTDDFEFAALAEARNYRAALRQEFGPWLRGRTLEVGAGIGQFSAELAQYPSITKLGCVEPEPRFAAKFRTTLPQLPFWQGTTADVPVHPGWDTLVCINVLEHIEDDAGELMRMCTLLRERRGHLCLFVPARPEIYAPIDRDFGHWRRYRRPELRQRLEQAGFRVERLIYFNFIGYFAWWLSFRILRQRTFRVSSVRAFDRWIFPVGHGCERAICRPPFGQSLLAIAQAT